MSGFRLKKSYDINEIVKKTSYSYNVSDSIQKLDDILYSSDGNKGNELASGVKKNLNVLKETMKQQVNMIIIRHIIIQEFLLSITFFKVMKIKLKKKILIIQILWIVILKVIVI